MKKHILFISAMAALAFGACKKKETETEPVLNAKYALEVRNTGYDVIGLHPVESLSSGQVEIKDASEALFSFYLGDWDIDGGIFARDYDPNRFTKYKYVDGKIEAVQTLPMLESEDPSANVRLDDNRVWFVRKIDGSTVYWDIVNTKTMSYVNSGTFTLPVKSGYNLMSGFANLLGDDIVFGYQQRTDDANETADSVYIAILDGDNITVQSLDRDNRSAAAGCLYSSSSFTAENGDVYFLTFPFANVGNNPAKPSAIMRIKNGETTIDDSYFFDVSAEVSNNNLNGPSIYMGNNKLLVQIVREDLVFDGDYWGAHEDGVFQNEYYVLDISTLDATKLDVPLSRGNGDGNPIKADDDTYAFVVNAENGNFVYTYNNATGITKKGIKYIGALVIYKLHNLK